MELKEIKKMYEDEIERVFRECEMTVGSVRISEIGYCQIEATNSDSKFNFGITKQGDVAWYDSNEYEKPKFVKDKEFCKNLYKKLLEKNSEMFKEAKNVYIDNLSKTLL